MPRKKQSSSRPIASYEHRDKERLNNPLVGLVTPETDPDAGQKKKRYAYDPHLDPQLVWAGKAEHTSFEVPTVSLHVHERIDPRTIIEAVRKDSGQWSVASGQLSLFEEERKEPLREAIEFYQHRHGWSNRLIAGDSLLVMNSLLEKEGMAGKVQMIYIDPPYGIKYGSNFQPFVNKRDVKDGKDEDLTAEPEQIRAFRDTWELGIHSYLTYLRDRLLLARELLTESGSIFVQISDENVHHVRELIDEVFGAGNFVSLITFRKTTGVQSKYVPSVSDYLLWYAKEKDVGKFRNLFRSKEGDENYRYLELYDGMRRRLSPEEIKDQQLIAEGAKVYRLDHPDSPGAPSSDQPFVFEGKRFYPPANRHWSVNLSGMEKLALANRLVAVGNSINNIRYFKDFNLFPITNLWEDTTVGGGVDRWYVVQTISKVIERCLLMTTDPGDLVFDPTCGSGTTAYVAEQWGRRWITCDTSRVALTLARQRLMTAVFDYYELAHPEEGVGSGFKYKTVPHVTLKSIANNPEIDGIYARMHPAIEKALAELNAALKGKPIQFKVMRGGRAGQVVDFAAPDSATFTMPSGQVVKVNELVEWEVPFEFPTDWPEAAREPFEAFHAARRAMQKAMDDAIARHAPQETLYDQPYVDRKKVRVTGPFTVEAVPAPAVKSPEEILEDKPQPADTSIARSGETLRQAEWRDELFRTGIRGKAGQYIRFARLEPLPGCRFLHAEGETRPSDEGADRVRETAPAYDPMRVVVSFGPEHAPLEQRQVAHAIEEAQALVPKPKLIVFAAFQFDPEAAKDIDEMKPELAGMQFLKVQMNADLLTEDLKKKRASNESFWLIGQPDVEVTSFEFLVLSGSQERIAEYGTFKKLSGLDSLAEVHRISWQDLFLYALLSQGRDIWAYLADQAGWDFHTGKYRGRPGQKQQGRIPPVSWNSAGLVGGIGDFAADLAEFGISDLNGCRRIVERLRRDQQIVGGLEALAQLLNFPIQPPTKNWQLKTKNLHCLAVHGFDYYNTKTGQIESGGADKIAVWLLDTDYDGRSLYPRQVFFPMAGENEGWAKLARNLKAEIDAERIDAYRGTVSLPFEAGEHKRIAVKIVDDRGIESLKVIDLNGAA
jgi:adenine-specific DNA-methyltransferase